MALRSCDQGIPAVGEFEQFCRPASFTLILQDVPPVPALHLHMVVTADALWTCHLLAWLVTHLNTGGLVRLQVSTEQLRQALSGWPLLKSLTLQGVYEDDIKQTNIGNLTEALCGLKALTELHLDGSVDSR